MKNWILSQCAKVLPHHRWAAVLFIQVWMWPQILDPHMPAGVGFSTIVTMLFCVVFNIIKMVNAYEDRDN
jgi:hypothetical protein